MLTKFQSYNSVILTTQAAIDYPAILVSEEFPANGTFEPTASKMPHCNDYKTDDFAHGEQKFGMEICTYQDYSDPPPSADQLRTLQRNASALQRLENTDCINAFGSNFQHAYRSVLLVSDASNTTDSVLDFTGSNNLPWAHGEHNTFSYNLDAYWWMCADWRNDTNNPPTWSCNIKNLIADAANWTMKLNDSTETSVKVDHCLVEPATK